MQQLSQKLKTMRLQPRLSLSVCLAVVLVLNSTPVAKCDGGTIKDVELTNTGTLRGHVIQPNGSTVSRANIQVRYQGKTIAIASTAADGQFAIEQVRGGLHEVVVAGQSTPVRFWTNGSAPVGCPPQLFSEVAMAPGMPCAPMEGCTDLQTYAPIQQCVPQQCSPMGMVDVVTIATLGSSIAALLVAIDANRSASEALSTASGTGSVVSAGTTTTSVASP